MDSHLSTTAEPNWGSKREWFALLVAGGETIKGAAAKVDAHERTAHGWLDDPEFRNHITKLRRRMIDEAVGKLVGVMGKAIDTLAALLDSDNPNVRLRAAQTVFDSIL